MAKTNKLPYTEMSETEFFDKIKGSLLLLGTSSPDKRDIYRELFSSLDIDNDNKAGVDLFFTDIGTLGIPPRVTEEKSGEYKNNLEEKSVQLFDVLKREKNNIREKLAKQQDEHESHGNVFEPKKVNIVGMAEDSGWDIEFADEQTKTKFIGKVKEKLKPLIREKDYWLLEKLDKTGFPGPNLKPVQEHLNGGFNEMMDIIYTSAKELNIENLRYNSHVSVSFVFPESKKVFEKSIEVKGRLLTEAEYDNRIANLSGEALNTDFICIPDGQHGTPKTLDLLIKDGIYRESSSDLPATHPRRDLTEWLQNGIGKRRSTHGERKRTVNVAHYSTSDFLGKDELTNILRINDLQTVPLPSVEELLADPHVKIMGDAHAVVLMPDNNFKMNGALSDDPNLRMLLQFITVKLVDPESMGVPLVLDNSNGGFDNALKVISAQFQEGKAMGSLPFIVANTDEELKTSLTQIKDFSQRSPVLKRKIRETDKNQHNDSLKSPPDDGIFTLFIAGGHANNSKRDLEEAQEFGYYCASKGWRIVTGAGSVEGSMGAIHTGFIQYYLDQFAENNESRYDSYKRSLNNFIQNDGNYDAEEIIKKQPAILNNMAEDGLIKKDLFWGYSTEPLLEMEGVKGNPPPATTFFDSGNIARRKFFGLLKAGTKVFLPGSMGTDEELVDAIDQHLKAKEETGDFKHFSDGTANDDGSIIIYNRGENQDKILENYGMRGNGTAERKKREQNNISLVDSIELLKETVQNKAESWQEKIATSKAQTSKEL